MRTPSRHTVHARLLALALGVALCGAPLATALPTGEETATPAPGPLVAPPAVDTVVPVPEDPVTRAFRQRLAARQAEIDALEMELEALDRQHSIAVEEYNQAAAELALIQTQLAATKADLAAAESALEAQQALLDERAVDLYRRGELRVLDVILGSKSVADLVGRARFLAALGQSDANVAQALRAQRDRIAEEAGNLQQAEQRAASLEFELRARQIEIGLSIEEREAMLAATSADLLDLLYGQAAERRREEADLLRAVLAGEEQTGISVEPGSPVETALHYHGVPYVWGGATPAGFDCSGLVMYVYAKHGVTLPHYAAAQFLLGEKVPAAKLKPGDLVFFGSPVYHVGMYVGGGYFLHAPRTGDFVKLSRLAARTDYAGARRYAWSYRTTPITDGTLGTAPSR